MQTHGIKSCPFCGGKDVALEARSSKIDADVFIRFLRCKTCGITTRPMTDVVDGPPEANIAKLYRRWNSRPRPANHTDMMTLVNQLRELSTMALSTRAKKNITVAQKEAMKMLPERINAILPTYLNRMDSSIPLEMPEIIS